jgi:hypothetical protein
MRRLQVGEPVDLGGHPVVPDGVLDQFGSALAPSTSIMWYLPLSVYPVALVYLRRYTFGGLRAQH